MIDERIRYTDQIDRAAQIEQEQRDDALAELRRKLPSGKSALRCTECRTRIPPERRKAVPGVELCVCCQELKEQVKGRYAGAN